MAQNKVWKEGIYHITQGHLKVGLGGNVVKFYLNIFLQLRKWIGRGLNNVGEWFKTCNYLGLTRWYVD